MTPLVFIAFAATGHVQAVAWLVAFIVAAIWDVIFFATRRR